MPHFCIEYSGNLEPEVDIGALCAFVRETAAGIDAFPMAGVRVRAFRCDHYSIADGNPDHAYIDMSIRLRGGRPDDVKKAATQAVFDAVKGYLAPVLAGRSLALSLEMRDIDPELSPKTGTIRDYLES